MERRDLTNGAEQRDFFISYTKTDKAWAVWIADVLKRNGYSVYCQALDIRPGNNFLEKMEEFLENSRNFIAVWSQGYSKSKYCMNELRAAFHEWNAGRVNCLLPVRVDNHPIKALYAALVRVDLSDMGAASEAELVNAVRLAVPLPNADAAPPIETTPDIPERDAERTPSTIRLRLYLPLAHNYYYGRNGVKQDYDQARYYYKLSAAQGNADALNHLGILYQYGRGVAVDYAKARYYYEQAAAKENADALNSLGLLYHLGHGVPKNYAKARYYYERAAAKGHDSALYNLGILYQYGRGVAKDYTKAWKYYKKVAVKGHALALYNLGALYENGQGVKQDYAKALEYYQKAADAGDEDAPEKVKELREKLKR